MQASSTLWSSGRVTGGRRAACQWWSGCCCDSPPRHVRCGRRLACRPAPRRRCVPKGKDDTSALFDLTPVALWPAFNRSPRRPRHQRHHEPNRRLPRALRKSLACGLSWVQSEREQRQGSGERRIARWMRNGMRNGQSLVPLGTLEWQWEDGQHASHTRTAVDPQPHNMPWGRACRGRAALRGQGWRKRSPCQLIGAKRPRSRALRKASAGGADRRRGLGAGRRRWSAAGGVVAGQTWDVLCECSSE